MSDETSRRSVLKAIGATSTVGGGLLTSTGLASAGSQNYKVTIRHDGPDYNGEYKLRIDFGSDGGSCDGESFESGEDDNWWDGNTLVTHGYVQDGDYDAWDCTSVDPIQVVDSDTDNVNIYEGGNLVGSW